MQKLGPVEKLMQKPSPVEKLIEKLSPVEKQFSAGILDVVRADLHS